MGFLGDRFNPIPTIDSNPPPTPSPQPPTPTQPPSHPTPHARSFHTYARRQYAATSDLFQCTDRVGLKPCLSVFKSDMSCASVRMCVCVRVCTPDTVCGRPSSRCTAAAGAQRCALRTVHRRFISLAMILFISFQSSSERHFVCGEVEGDLGGSPVLLQYLSCESTRPDG